MRRTSIATIRKRITSRASAAILNSNGITAAAQTTVRKKSERDPSSHWM